MREAEVMDKKPLLIFRWNRSKILLHLMTKQMFLSTSKLTHLDVTFKVSKLDDWIEAVKKQSDLA